MEGLSILRGNQAGISGWPEAPTSFKPQDVGATLTGFQRPIRVEGEIYNLEIEGEIPKSIAGTFYRIMPDPAFPPFIKDDIVRWPGSHLEEAPLLTGVPVDEWRWRCLIISHQGWPCRFQAALR